jgi:hypothetical protein
MKSDVRYHRWLGVMGAVLGKIVKGAAKMTFEQTPR